MHVGLWAQGLFSAPGGQYQTTEAPESTHSSLRLVSSLVHCGGPWVYAAAPLRCGHSVGRCEAMEGGPANGVADARRLAMLGGVLGFARVAKHGLRAVRTIYVHGVVVLPSMHRECACMRPFFRLVACPLQLASMAVDCTTAHSAH